jgi:hypothetical protein
MENNITWRICPIADFFEVSTNGDVRLVTKKRIIKPWDNGNGYLCVSKVFSGKKRKNYYIHRLVASAYLDNTQNLPEVNHKDGNKHNNNITNLEWCSRGDNVRHAFQTGLSKPSEKQREAARKTAQKNLSVMREGWKKWYATEEGKKKHIAHAMENLKIINESRG